MVMADPEPMTFFHASLLALRGQLGHDAVDDFGGGKIIGSSGEIVAQSGASFLQRLVHFLSFDDAVFDQEIAKFCNNQGISNGDPADVGCEIVWADHGVLPLGKGDSSGPVPQTPEMNYGIPADHRVGEIAENPPEKGWTPEIASAAVTDSVGIPGAGAGGGRSVTYIGPGLWCNRNGDLCQGKSDA
jgi:hypothetical protein